MYWYDLVKPDGFTTYLNITCPDCVATLHIWTSNNYIW